MPRYVKNEWSGTKQKILMLHMSGKTQTEIAEKIGKDVSTVNRHIYTPEFQTRKERLEVGIREKVIKKFADKALWAAEKLVKIAEKGVPEDRIRFDAIKEILYQVGCKPVEIVETRRRDYTPEEVQSAMVVVKEMETIADRLGKVKSPFIVNKKVDILPPAPCQETQKISDETTKASSGEPDLGESPKLPGDN